MGKGTRNLPSLCISAQFIFALLTFDGQTPTSVREEKKVKMFGLLIKPKNYHYI